jgi:hypothetical protein
MQQVTLGFSVHRPEMIPFISDLMQRHEALFLEEPPTADFRQMLQGVVSVEDYLIPLDVEYPEFSRRMCCLLRELHGKGKKIFQVEPFMESLLAIHAFFAEGHGPEELNKDSLQHPVYLAERNATAALLAYYRTVMHESFDKTIVAIKQFARMDAARFRLRDSLRAQELASLIEKYSSSYVEAGVIHYPLWRLLRQQVSSQIRVRPVFLADAALKTMKEKGHLYGPGDLLTLLYMFHPNITTTMREQVLAARSIIYSKIIVKEELNEEAGTFPHLRDELDCIRATRQLTLDDCRRLFPLVRRAKSSDARQIVAEYLAESKPQMRSQRPPA